MRRLLPVLATLVLLPVATAVAGPRVVGGHDAPGGTYDAVARITFPAGSCSGTLVSPRWVLTAGHCASVTGELFGTPITYPAVSYAVVLGTTRTDGTGGTTYAVDDIRTPPGYLGSRASDAALLHLTTDAAQSPVRVAGRGAESLWAPGTLETIAGFGVTQDGATAAPATMQVAQVPIVADATCAAAYPDDPQAPTYPDVFAADTEICAGYPQGGTDTCQGDSGGPLFGHDADGALKLVGSTSRGHGCAQPGFPGIYARLGAPTLREWVRGIAPDAVDDHVALTPTKSTPSTPGTPTAPGAPSPPALPDATGGGSPAGTDGSASGSSAPGAGHQPPGAATPFRARVSLRPARRAAFAARGVAVVVTCSAGCDAALRLRVDGRTVARHHIGDRLVGRATADRGAGGRLRVRVRLRRDVRTLARDRRARFSVAATVVPAAGGRTVRVARGVRLR